MPPTPSTDRWARFRFLVVGPLLAAPPASGELRAALTERAQRSWPHPITSEPTRLAFSTIERWYYEASVKEDPIAALRRKPRRDHGRFYAVGEQFARVLRAQYREHASWSVALHRDNLKVLVEKDPSLGSLPSYSTLRRYMAHHGLTKRRRRPTRRDGEGHARARIESHEVRSYESEHVQGLWHLDFHHGSRKILAPSGEWVRPILLAVLDDRSRLLCHAQWFFEETAQRLVHGLIQAILKRGLPRALLSDNGAAMLASETTEGLARLGIVHQRTLPYSPHQNGKQEVFWVQVEGRLIPMLEGEPELSLSLLNQATLAWIERGYQRSRHSETGQTPLERWQAGPCVGRPAPTPEDLRLAFTTQATRTQRKSDGTLSLAGRRFEVPDRFRHLRQLKLRFASWDLRRIWIVDPRTDTVLSCCYPLDRARNADHFRRPRHSKTASHEKPSTATGIAPLLQQLMEEYAATGLPPAYIPTEET